MSKEVNAELEEKKIDSNLTLNAEDHEEDLDDENLGSDSENKYIQKLRKQLITWKNRAKENHLTEQQRLEAENRIKESEKKSEQALSEINAMRAQAQKRLVSAEIRAVASEMGLKRPEYAALADNSKIVVNENGEVQGVREMLEDLKKNDPDLFAMATTTNKYFTNVQKTDSVSKKDSLRSLNDSDYNKKEREFLKTHRR